MKMVYWCLFEKIKELCRSNNRWRADLVKKRFCAFSFFEYEKLFNEFAIYTCVSVSYISYKSRDEVNLELKVDFLKGTSINHFHSCFLVFFYHVSIISKNNWEFIFPCHLFVLSNGMSCPV